MISMLVKESLATTASICTILQFLAGVLVCKKFIKNGTTGDASGLAFVTCYMSCSLWLRYGQLIEDKSIVFVNVFGAVLQISYAFVFYMYCLKKSVVLNQFTTATILLLFVYAYSFYAIDKNFVIRYVGFMSCTLTIIFFASPLISLAHVMRTNNADSLPFPVIFTSLIVCCQWFAYGCLLHDSFIQIPNFLGAVLSAFQLSLFFIYSGKKSDQTNLV